MFLRSTLLAAAAYLVAAQTLVAQQASHGADTATVVRSDTGSARTPKPTELERVRVVDRAGRRSSYSAAASRTLTRTDTPLRDTPQSATVLTRAVIADQAMQGMADVVRYVPGMTMGLGEGHRDQPTIRGNSSTADFFVNGVRDDAQYLRDLYNVERVEAIRGANAMVFGRGGGGGVINRVSKQAGFVPGAQLTIEGGSFDHARETGDVNLPLGSRAAVRVNGMLERSASFRDYFHLRREGVNPTATILAGGTVVKLGYEWFNDQRTVDRGIPSFGGAPLRTAPAAFFGDPNENRAHARVHAADVSLEHSFGPVSLRYTTRGVRYDKFYQNVFPGGMTADGASVQLRAYNHATKRDNLFNQLDLTRTLVTGSATHTLLVGGELSRQGTDDFRETGYFDDGTASSITVPLGAPVTATGVRFRQSPTDADNHTRLDIGAGYVQDQVAFGPHWQAIAGVRVDRFDLRFHDNRAGRDLSRVDHLVSPRGGLIFKPVEQASLYGSYSVSHLPGSGDQFASLTPTTETLEPERFVNRELGAKWDVTPSLALTAAVYRLDRSNSQAPDPNDPSRVVQTGAQRTMGLELGASGDVTDRWQLAGGWASQRARIVNPTKSGAAGATVPLVPQNTLSLWNRVQLTPALGVGFGAVHQSRAYAALDNAVTLPAFTRYDAGLYLSVLEHARLQVNMENLLGASYYATAHGNNNIMPGAPRTLRVSVSVED
ncbi:MAG TPA: TonB-dependent siderophore receptor [Gemmatimonadaceae bacterium]|nr:TonB-dependent siderophore receptor [Gemmatimonadaceae bacterium]